MAWSTTNIVFPSSDPSLWRLSSTPGSIVFRFPSQLGLNAERVATLNGLFPQAGFGTQAVIPPNTQPPRATIGLELQVLMPVVNAPFRLYWGYNLSYLNTNLQPPIVADRSFFPNNATYQNYLQYGVPTVVG